MVGGGIIGSWAALHLVEAGAEVTLFEQFPLPHTRGSSHGMSRAFRYLGEHELGRLDYSFARWLALERQFGQTMFVRTGLINLGPPGDSDLEHFMSVLRGGNRPVEWLDSATIADRYPMLNYPSEWGAAYDPNGGLLLAHRCLGAVQSQFVERGGTIETARVKGVERDAEQGVEIEVQAANSDANDRRSFDRAVVCAGPWTGKLVPNLAQHLTPLLTPVTYWHDPSGSYTASSGVPIVFNARLTGIYGIPGYEYPGMMKMLYHGGPESDPDLRDSVSADDFVEKVRCYIQAHLPSLRHESPAILETCMYTMTADGNPIIDRLGASVVVGCGFSGSGFKHSPATGLMLAALALGQDEAIPGDFRADRYLAQRLSCNQQQL